jgi:cytochrome c-type biogenesis protein CcmH
MMTFWLIAGAMTLVALGCVVTPLVRRADGGAAVSSPRHAALAGALIALLPLSALALYMRLGEPMALVIAERAERADQPTPGEAPASLEIVVSRLAMRLRDGSGDGADWTMLARSYAALERPRDAAAAYRRALESRPRDADLLADYADAMASVNGGDLSGAPMQSIEAALAIAPDHPKALALAASAALDRGDLMAAIGYWERLEHAPGVDPAIGQQARRNIEQTREMAAKRASIASAGASKVRVGVRLSPSFADRVHAGDIVFVYALADDGNRMPLAIKRVRVDQLPASIDLDDSMAMTPTHRLSDAGRIRIFARVSASGHAEPAAGDLSGSSGPVMRGREKIDVVIDDVVK